MNSSYIEIYNENIFDLLNQQQNPLNVREDTQKGIYIENV